MANEYEVASWLTMTSSDILESKRAVSQFFNKKYSKEFGRAFPVGESIKVPFPRQFRSRRGLEYDPQNIKPRHADVTFEEPLGVDFEYDDVEAMFNMPRGKEQIEKLILEPAMSQISAEIDYFCATYAAQNAASLVGILGTNPTTYDTTSAAARQIMMELGCPETGERGVILPPAVVRAVKNSSSTYMNPSIEISKQFRTGVVGTADGALWHESPVLYRHTAGSWNVAGVTVATTVTSAAVGATTTSVALTCTTGDTFLKGDKISFSATYPVHPQTRQRFNATTKTFTVTASTVGVSSTATVVLSPAMYGPDSPYQNVDALPLASATLTLWPGTSSPSGKTGIIGLYIHENAFGLVGKPLPTPKVSSVEIVSQTTDPDSGMSVRFIRQWDNQSSKMTNRFDTDFGAGVFFNDACCVAIACA